MLWLPLVACGVLLRLFSGRRLGIHIPMDAQAGEMGQQELHGV